jgi:ribokinase
MPDVDVCVVGSVNLDLVLTAARLPKPGETVLGRSFAQHPGGKGLNQAVAAARAGAQTALCCCIGADEAGRSLRQEVTRAGLGEDNIHLVTDLPTGRALIGVDDQGQNFIIVVPGANSALAPAMAVAAVRGARVALAQLEVPVDAVTAAFRTARDGGTTTILNASPAEAATSELLSLSDYVVLNEHEVLALGGAEEIFAAGAGELVITLGERGSIHDRRGGESHAVSSFPVSPVDTTAAGDAYCGAFAAALGGGRSVHDAMRMASAAGALATTKPGAVPSLPQRSEIDRLLGAV